MAIDDFGIGYSNLHNLKSLNVDILKIDKSFVETLTTHKTSHLIAEHIIELAHSLGLKRSLKASKLRSRLTGCANAACAIARDGFLRRRCRRRCLCNGWSMTRAGVNARAINLQAVAIIAGSAIKLPTENAGEGLLRDITQVHCDIKNRTLGGAQLNGGQ